MQWNMYNESSQLSDLSICTSLGQAHTCISGAWATSHPLLSKPSLPHSLENVFN